MDKAPRVSRDALRHVDDQRHHVERSKVVRLDRKDCTGRGHELEKKHGAGKGNWGPMTDSSAVAMRDDDVDAGPDAVSPHDFVDNDKVFTLDEYEARKLPRA